MPCSDGSAPPSTKWAGKQLEACVFLNGARQWIDHGLAGDIPLAESAHAARLLCDRAEQFTTLAA